MPHASIVWPHTNLWGHVMAQHNLEVVWHPNMSVFMTPITWLCWVPQGVLGIRLFFSISMKCPKIESRMDLTKVENPFKSIYFSFHWIGRSSSLFWIKLHRFGNVLCFTSVSMVPSMPCACIVTNGRPRACSRVLLTAFGQCIGKCYVIVTCLPPIPNTLTFCLQGFSIGLGDICLISGGPTTGTPIDY